MLTNSCNQTLHLQLQTNSDNTTVNLLVENFSSVLETIHIKSVKLVEKLIYENTQAQRF